MRILSIGTDQKVFDRDSESARRMIGYGETVERYDIIAKASPEKGDIELSPKTRVYAARGRFFLLTVLSAAWRVRKNAKWDVVTAENPFDIGLASWIVARLSGTAFHLQVHGDFYGSKEWRNASFVNRWMKYPLAVFLVRRADGVRVVSERIKTSLVARGVAVESIAVSPIGDVACQTDRQPVAKSERPTVLFVGRFEKEKNPSLLIEAFATVVRSLPEARLRLVGEGSLLETMKGRIATLGIVEAVDVVAWSDALAPEYDRASVLAVPSDHEGWGRVAVEAACHRLPVVMTDVGCAGEFVMDGGSGWVVPVGDAEAMAKAIVDALTRKEEAKGRADNLWQALSDRNRTGSARETLVRSWEAALETFGKVTSPALRDLKRLLAVALVAHLAVYLLFLIRFGTGGEWGWYVLGSDDLGYLRLARNVWHGVFSQSVAPPFLPDSDRMPLYPLFLSLLRFVPGWSVIALQQFFSIGGVLLWYRLAKRIAPPKVAFWSAALFALEPTMRFWTAQFATEALFAVFWFGALLAFSNLLTGERRRMAAIAGALLGLSILTRPIALFYPAVLVVVLIVSHRRDLLVAARLSVVMLAATAVILAPWVTRNAIVFGLPAVSLKGSSIMFGENAPTYVMWKYGITREVAFGNLLSMLPKRDYVLPYDNGELDRAVSSLVKRDPIGFSYVMSLSAIPFFLGDGYVSNVRVFLPSVPAPIVRWNGSVSGYLHDLFASAAGAMTAVFVFGKIFTASVFLFASVGACGVFRKRETRIVAIWLVLTVLYFAATSGTIAYSRYRFPIQPVLFLFAGYGMMALWSKSRARRSTQA